MTAYKVVSGTARDVVLRSWTSVAEAYDKVVRLDQPATAGLSFVSLLSASATASAELDLVAQSVYKLGNSGLGPGRPLGVRSRHPAALDCALHRMAKAGGVGDAAASLMTLAKEARLVKLGRPLPIEDCPRPSQSRPFPG